MLYLNSIKKGGRNVSKFQDKLDKNLSKLSNRTIVIIAFIAIISGLLLISADYLEGKKERAYQKIRISLFTEVDDETHDNTPQNIEEPEQPEQPYVPAPNPNGYLGILTIDKINLEQGFYDKNYKDNNVSKNLTFLSPSNYPDEKNGNVILVAHSGTTRIAYFKNLYQLKVGDKAKIEYKGHLYTYKIDNIYNETKDGDVTIYRDTNRQTLTMITCTKNDNTKQTIYIAYLESVK